MVMVGRFLVFLIAGFAASAMAQGTVPTSSEEQPARAATESAAPQLDIDCTGDTADVIARVEEASDEERKAIVDACLAQFNEAAERLRESNNADGVYSMASQQLEFQLRMLQSFSRDLEPGGRFERNISALNREIEELQTQIGFQKKDFPERAAALEADLQKKRADYEAQVDEYGRLRELVAEKLTELTTFRPIIALELRVKDLGEVIATLETAISAAAQVAGDVIEASDGGRQTE